MLQNMKRIPVATGSKAKKPVSSHSQTSMARTYPTLESRFSGSSSSEKERGPMISYLRRWNHKRSERARARLKSHENFSVSADMERSPPKNSLSNYTLIDPYSFLSARPLATATQKSAGQTKMMTIEKLVYGDGSNGNDKRFLSREQIFAAPNRQGGLESFCRI